MIASLVNPLRGQLSRLRRDVRDALRGETDATYFDLNNLPRLNAFLASHGLPPLVADPAEAAASVPGAMRYILARAVLQRGSLTSARFAKSLAAGVNVRAAENIRAAFAADPGLRVRRVYELREDLRGVFPLGLTPRQRGEYLAWLLTYGKTDFQLSPEAALWFHLELDEDPARGLAFTYRLQPEWQREHPEGLTAAGWPQLKAWVAHRYDFDCRWLRRATLAEPETTDRDGVNVLGLFRYTSGLQQAVRSSVESLRRVGVSPNLRDYPVLFLREPHDRTRYDALERADITIVNTGIDTGVSDAFRKTGLHPREGVYRIGNWWWELEELPKMWHARGDEVDEIWAPTEFIAGAMRGAFCKPVFSMLPGLELSPFTPRPKTAFGMDPGKTTFAFIFDMNSRMQRKNPLGLIAAFRRAFQPDEPVELVIKVSPPESYYRDQWNELRAAADASGVRLLDRVMSRDELLAFLNATDAYASLHRSEGFGLTCAEAMLLGKPVVATNYSGNTDFMNARNSYLVAYDRVQLADDIDPYPRGAYWAEPNLDHAAAQMRAITDDPAAARATGERARESLRETLSLEAAGKRMKARLDAIRTSRGR